MATKTLQLLRNASLYDDYTTALAGLKAQLAKAFDGEPIIARYNDGGKVKTLCGVAHRVEGAEEATYDIAEMYDSQFDELTVPNTIGGIKAGVSVADLKEKSISEVLDMLLFPELNPVVTAPSASISFKNGFSNNQILEVGAAAPVVDKNFTTGLTRGKCTVAGRPDKNRAGELVAGDSFIYYGDNVATKTLPEKVSLGDMVYKYHAAYGKGDTLVTSYGNTASEDSTGKSIENPLAAGFVNSGAIHIFGTYPYFCNGTSASSDKKETDFPTAITNDTKLALQKWTDTLIGAKFASEASTKTRLVFEFPAAKKVTKVEFMNTLSGNWEVFTDYEIVDAAAKDVQGASVDYKRLTTVGNLSGALQLRFTVENV